MSNVLKGWAVEVCDDEEDFVGGLPAEPVVFRRTDHVNDGSGDTGFAPRVVEVPQARPAGEEKAQEIIAQAQREADRLLEAARQSARELYRRGYDKGVEEGRAKGLAEGNAVIEARVAALQTLCEVYGSQRADHDAEVERDAVDFAFDLAEKIIHTELDRNDAAFLNLCKDTASRITGQGPVTLRVGPREYDIARVYEKELRRSVEGLPEIEIVPAPGEPGCCRFETPSGVVDASVSSRLRRAREMLALDAG